MTGVEGYECSWLPGLCVAVDMFAFWTERYEHSGGMDFDWAVSEGSYATKRDP